MLGMILTSWYIFKSHAKNKAPMNFWSSKKSKQLFTTGMHAKNEGIYKQTINGNSWPIIGYTRSLYTGMRYWKQWLFTIYKKVPENPDGK